jgi:hypothetical protein
MSANGITPWSKRFSPKSRLLVVPAQLSLDLNQSIFSCLAGISFREKPNERRSVNES